MKRARGFTLVELLVVIGIIAVLISILLPALSRVRGQAQIVKCSAQMRDIVTALIMYTNENRGALPPFRLDKGQATYDLYPPGDNGPFAYLTNLVYDQSSALTLAELQASSDDGAGLGRLMKRKYLPFATTSYRCPNALGDSDLATSYLSNYFLNPHLKYVTVGVPSPVHQWWWKKINNYGRYTGGTGNYRNVRTGATGSFTMQKFRRAILTDPTAELAKNTHSVGRLYAWNLAYSDGSVLTYKTNQIPSLPTTDSWARMLDLSHAIQAAADGRTVDWKNFGGKWALAPIDPQ